MDTVNHQTFFPLVSASEKKNSSFSADFGLQKYLQEINSYKILTRAETEELAIKVLENGDTDAAHNLVIANLRLVVKIALDYQKYWRHNFLDLIQEGNTGLVLSIRKFDPKRGIKFSYYASYWIKAYILRFIQDNWRMIKICTTQTMRRLFFNLNKEKRKLEAQGIEPDNAILSKRLKVSKSKLVDAQARINRSDIELECQVNESSEKTYHEYIPKSDDSIEDSVAQKDTYNMVRRILDKEKEKLDLREKIILKDRLMSDSPRTLDDIANQLSLSRERIRQIEVNLLKKLKTFLCQHMPDFVWEN